jgi:energy-coupling factor transporter transmembrane protein EcfT
MAKKDNFPAKSKKSNQTKNLNKGTTQLQPGMKSPSFSGVVIAFFTAFIILLVRMSSYERPMDQFFWSTGINQLSDFFSYIKMVAIIICGILALLILLYQIVTQSFYIKKSYAYIPIAIYMIFVLLSYLFAEYKEFSLLGYNDRFEGTLVLLCYMVMLFFIIHSINTERWVKWIVYPLAVSSTLLGILGLSQAIGRDFFKTTIGKKLITPSSYWEHVDNLKFTFNDNEIYQTVYNINYVSFYLTLLIPLFGMLFIHEKKIYGKLAWGALFTLSVYNLIGSESSGGLIGMVAVVLIAAIVLNKRILNWKKPVLVLIALTILVGAGTYQRWTSELSTDFDRAQGKNPTQIEDETPEGDVEITPRSIRPNIDYIETHQDSVIFSLNGEALSLKPSVNADGMIDGLTLFDSDSKIISLLPTEEQDIYSIEDERFHDYATVSYSTEGDPYLRIYTEDASWKFASTEDGIFFVNQLNNYIRLSPTPSIGWQENPDFGSGRGYIWSRSIPMIRETLLIGHGADTYCLYFPHEDYAGKYSANWGLNRIVDKPHNLYLGVAINTGLISLLALLALWGVYIVQSCKLYFRAKYEDFLTFVGAGIFLGICGFFVAALFNDSSVSVMPMFYGLLGTGIAINRMLNSNNKIPLK